MCIQAILITKSVIKIVVIVIVTVTATATIIVTVIVVLAANTRGDIVIAKRQKCSEVITFYSCRQTIPVGKNYSCCSFYICISFDA